MSRRQRRNRGSEMKKDQIPPKVMEKNAYSPQHALVLFDQDGFTSVVNTNNLNSRKTFIPNLRCTFHHFGKEYLCEILMLSDSKSDLNKYEREWSSTNRAVIIENTMAEGKEHGYLDIRVTKRAKTKRVINARFGKRGPTILKSKPAQEEVQDEEESETKNKPAQEEAQEEKESETKNKPAQEGIQDEEESESRHKPAQEEDSISEPVKHLEEDNLQTQEIPPNQFVVGQETQEDFIDKIEEKQTYSTKNQPAEEGESQVETCVEETNEKPQSNERTAKDGTKAEEVEAEKSNDYQEMDDSRNEEGTEGKRSNDHMTVSESEDEEMSEIDMKSISSHTEILSDVGDAESLNESTAKRQKYDAAASSEVIESEPPVDSTVTDASEWRKSCFKNAKGKSTGGYTMRDSLKTIKDDYIGDTSALSRLYSFPEQGERFVAVIKPSVKIHEENETSSDSDGSGETDSDSDGSSIVYSSGSSYKQLSNDSESEDEEMSEIDMKSISSHTEILSDVGDAESLNESTAKRQKYDAAASSEVIESEPPVDSTVTDASEWRKSCFKNAKGKSTGGYTMRDSLKTIKDDYIGDTSALSRLYSFPEQGERFVAVIKPSVKIHEENETSSDSDGSGETDSDSDGSSIVYSSGSSYKQLSNDSESEDEEMSEIDMKSISSHTEILSDVGDAESLNESTAKRQKYDAAASSEVIESEPPVDSTVTDASEWRKSCFKNVSVESYETKTKGKRNYSKAAYCLYCRSKFLSRISKHYFAVHLHETRVNKIRQMPVKSKTRKAELQKLLFEGNFNHNVKVLQKGVGTIVVYRRPSGLANAYDYLPCQYCKGFFHSKLLWSHSKHCVSKKNTMEGDSERNFIREAKCMLTPFLKKEDEEVARLDEIIERMKETKDNPGLKKICERDELIREFGVYQLGRLGPTVEQRYKDQDNIRTKMRSLARLLTKLNENSVFDHPLTFYISPTKFFSVANQVKTLYQEVNSAQFGISLGHYVKQACLLKASLGLCKGDRVMKQEANDFMELFEAQWKSKVSSVANRSKRLKALNKRSDLPLTQDLVKLKDFLTEEMKMQSRNMAPSYAEYVNMTHVLIARIVLFNKRRIAEVSELKVEDLQRRIKGDELDTNTEIYNSLNVSERTLLKRMELVEVRGKSTRGLRKVFVILSTDVVKGLQHLLMIRMQAGIHPSNIFLFARTTESPQDGCEAMRVVTAACPDLEHPDRIRTTKLRKYLATTTQVMDMTGDELKLLADHMGHSVAIHTEVYRMQTSVLERTKVARALVALEAGNLTQYRGRSMSSIDIDELPEPGELETEPDISEIEDREPEVNFQEQDVESSQIGRKKRGSAPQKRQRWTNEEEECMRKAFAWQFSKNVNASTTDIRAAIKSYPVLNGRTEAMIRSKINNIILGKSSIK